MTEESEVFLPYATVLRAIGRMLDEKSPERFSMVESPKGYHLSLEHDGQTETLVLSRPDVATYVETMAKQRGKRKRSAVPWALGPTSHQDFLRALGYELDDSQASAIVLDELDDAVLVTYSYPAPSQGFTWGKKMAVIHAEQAAEIMEASQERRGSATRRGWPFG